MEIAILIWVHQTFHHLDWLNHVMKYITYLGNAGLICIVTAAILMIFKRTRWAGVAVAVGLILDVTIVNLLLKNVVQRPRPWTEYEDFALYYEAFDIKLPTDYSFPSGHSAATFCAAVALIAYYKLKGLPALAVAFMIALSRIYLCVHYPTDVLAGIAIGSLCGLAGYFIAKKLKMIFEQKKLKE